MPNHSERGIAMISTLLVLMLMSALLVGFTSVVVSDQRYRFIDRDRSQAFYAASGGVEKLTADLGNLFFANVAPTASQLTVLTGNRPGITGVSYTAAAAPSPLPSSLLSLYGGSCDPAGNPSRHPVTTGTSGYTVMFCTDATGNPVVVDQSPIKTGPYEGLIALQTPYQLDVTAKTVAGGEAHLSRTIEAVAIPVFQFGIFSDVDLSFFAGPNFDFGGRVHSNGNLFLSEGDGATLTLRDKVTVVKEIIRQRLQNGVSIDTPGGHTGTVSMALKAGTFRALARTEGSVVDGPTSAVNEPTWHTTSLSTYNNWIRNGRTGAKALNLSLLTVGGANTDLIRRGTAGEDSGNPILFNERLFSKASLRILLSDTASDITSLPTVTATAPVQLEGDWKTTPPAGYGPVDASHPPIARTPGLAAGTATTTTNANTLAGAASIGVSAVPTMFLNPVTLTINGIVPVTLCTGRTATTFTGCTFGTNATAGQTVTATSRLGNFTASTTLTANVSKGSNKTLPVVSTWSFAANSFWIGDSLVTCEGPNAALTQLTNCTNVPASTSGAAVTFGAASSVDTATIGGYIKIERQSAAGVWTDVTLEILNYGIGGPNLDGVLCGDPTPNAILRIQRLRDNGNPASCPTTGSLSSYDYWPNVLFDVREGLARDTSPGVTTVPLGGVMHYITLDVANLTKWFRATAPFAAGSGASSRTDNGGFTVYFSDRRNNRTAGNLETAEYGWEDFVNPLAADGAPNGALDGGEDVNGNGTLETYGSLPNYNGVSGSLPPGAIAPLNGAARHTTMVSRAQAEVNRAILFRRALKLINGSAIAASGVTGLTIVAENPVYVQGDWNAAGAFNDPHAATSVMADAVTLLSNNWNDKISFTQPYAEAGRPRGTQSWYRLAIIAGKGMAFAQPAGTATDFGTDGGAHNFLRYLEDGDQAVNYRGSIATFFYNRQAVGTYKCCNTVYGAPARNYAFDIEFLTPALLPPNTPVFRDMNAIGFSQELRPGK